MKKLITCCFIGLLSFYANRVDANEGFDSKLELLAPYMGTCQSVFKSENSEPSVVDVSL